MMGHLNERFRNAKREFKATRDSFTVIPVSSIDKLITLAGAFKTAFIKNKAEIADMPEIAKAVQTKKSTLSQ
jgi:hypothetical protein